MTDIDLAELKRLATDALESDQPWHSEYHLRGEGMDPEDAAFVAAVNPVVFAALVERAERAEARTNATQDALDWMAVITLREAAEAFETRQRHLTRTEGHLHLWVQACNFLNERADALAAALDQEASA